MVSAGRRQADRNFRRYTGIQYFKGVRRCILIDKFDIFQYFKKYAIKRRFMNHQA
jgi:hypothetical protein